MFTGIVQGISRVIKVTDLENSRRMCLDLGDLTFNLNDDLTNLGNNKEASINLNKVF